MSKYDRLGTYLRGLSANEVPMTFAEIERVVGTKLPKSQESQAWWSNSPSNNVMTKVWLAAGFETTQVDMGGKKLVFARIRPRGKAEDGPAFQHAQDKRPRRSPLFGALKGTFTIEPGYDLTQPTLAEDWEKAFEEKWDRGLLK
ncbi:MAG: hypothetical protein KGJ79_02610 [Alphaproteobacteria bacterium]|nr:hypothetical protein [Alphaproteobacteria bacterium]MDE2110006.1 hypothetical protein [Alphaproteobacteria bacterium]MDE2494933.1 hypothetical protein [Alphaproteobacteria bacterium]